MSDSRLSKTTALLLSMVLLPALASAQQNPIVTVGDTVCSMIVARDGNGNTIRDWERSGTPAILTLHNSTANTDTSAQSWNADSDGYTLARILHKGTELPKLNPNEWRLDPALFSNGATQICLVHSKADTGVYFEITPKQTPLHQESGPMDFIPSVTANVLVALTSAVPGEEAVYLKRKYEIIVTPRDRYLNPTDETIGAYFSARWPGEFVSDEPGLSGIFPGKMFIAGATNYFFASINTHGPADAQWVRVTSADNPDIYGATSPYEVRDHAPDGFKLQLPVDNSILPLIGYAAPMVFKWENATDPYTDVQISAWSQEKTSDEVRYKIFFIDSASLTKKVVLDSDNQGRNNQFTTTHGQMLGICQQIAGGVFYLQRLMWLVEASDGLYTSWNTERIPGRPLPGFYLHILYEPYPPDAVSHIPSAPTGIALHQNYPNPVPSGTMANIRFETTGYGPVRMKVYDMLGSEVATLADESLAPGSYNANFSATGLAPGVYHYTLTAGGKATTRSMVITK